MAIDNVLIDINRKNDCVLNPVMNGLSDHDAQLITLKKISLKPSTKHFKVIRTLDENLLNDFLNKLSYEM